MLERQLAEATRAQAEALKTEAKLQAELKRVEATAAEESARLRKENAETLAALKERADVAVEPAERKTLEAFSAEMLQRLEKELAVRDKQAAEQVISLLFSVSFYFILSLLFLFFHGTNKFITDFFLELWAKLIELYFHLRCTHTGRTVAGTS